MKYEVWGHRGASGYAPENTLTAFKMAEDMGADGIELDVQMSKDGVLVICHDETIDRTSSGTGFIKDMTFEELRKYNYNKTHPEYEHADIPTLEEVLALVKPGKMIINIELKTGIFFYPGIEEKVVALVKQYGMEDRVIYSSFNHYSAKHIHDIDPGARTAFLYEDGPIDMPEYAHRHGVNAIHPALYNLQYENIMEDAAKYGLEVNVWTVNTEEYVRFCMMKGVHGIITNYPDMARKVTGYE
ncbi:MAG: glycerophosphodiester phosphodiesterase [Solobacterium sp.]|nr:glycerophosphodiester phosphodiesterase [Solobacterium sp.]